MEKGHRNTPASALEIEAAIRPDLEPLYALEPAEYHKGLYGNRIINQLTNVVIATIEHLQDAEYTRLAQTLAEQAHLILLDYDEVVTSRFSSSHHYIA